MNDDAKKDLVPALVIFLMCVMLRLKWWMILIALIPLVFFLLYFLGIVRPQGVYSPEYRQGDRLDTEMFRHDHPVLMPRIFYLLQSMQMYLFGICLFWIPPVCRYFMNWGKVAWNMLNTSSSTLPHPPGASRNQQPPIWARQVEKKVREQVAKTQSRPVPPTGKPKQKTAGQKEKDISRRVIENALREIENNHQMLLSLQQTTQEALETMFEGSELTQNRFMKGIDDAVEMSKENLKLAREYVKLGRNPEIMQEFLNRSQSINKKAEALIDALVKHQQGRMEDSLDSLNQSLDELQDSLKYYQ